MVGRPPFFVQFVSFSFSGLYHPSLWNGVVYLPSSRKSRLWIVAFWYFQFFRYGEKPKSYNNDFENRKSVRAAQMVGWPPRSRAFFWNNSVGLYYPSSWSGDIDLSSSRKTRFPTAHIGYFRYFKYHHICIIRISKIENQDFRLDGR